MSYYKRIEKSEDWFYNYEELKNKDGVIVSNDNKGEFILVPTEMLGKFVPTTISRADLESRGFDPNALTDEQMQELADKMGSIWVGFDGYWEEMDECAQLFGLVQKEEGEGEEYQEINKLNQFRTPIKCVRCTEIDWCVEPTDVPNFEEKTDEEIEKAIEEIEATLPKEELYPLPQITSDGIIISEFVSGLDEKMSNEYGFLIKAFNYELIGIDGKSYEFFHGN